MNVPLSWGKPKIFIKKLGDNTAVWKLLATPVEDSTNLSTTQGDKIEAKIEGGSNEAVKYKKNTYQFLYNIRKAQGRNQPMPNNDGVVKSEYSVLMQPEDVNTDGIYIERTSANIQDTFTTAEGAIWAVTHDALEPANGNTVKWGKVTTAVANETKTVKFEENEDMVADGATAIELAAAEYVDND